MIARNRFIEQQLQPLKEALDYYFNGMPKPTSPILTAAHALEAAQSAFELALSTDTGQVSKERYRELEQAHV